MIIGNFVKFLWINIFMIKFGSDPMDHNDRMQNVAFEAQRNDHETNVNQKSQQQQQPKLTNCDIIILPLSLTVTTSNEINENANQDSIQRQTMHSICTSACDTNAQLSHSMADITRTTTTRTVERSPNLNMLNNEHHQQQEEQLFPPAYCSLPGIVPSYRGRNSGPPPAYADVINPDANPPTYQSLYGQVCEARKTSRTLCQLTRRLLVIILSTIGCTLLIGLIAFAPLAMIAMGSFYLDECRIEHLPAFLLMGGLVLLIKNILQCYNHCEPIQPATQPISGFSRQPSSSSRLHHQVTLQHTRNGASTRVATFSLVEAELNRSSTTAPRSRYTGQDHVSSSENPSYNEPCLIYGDVANTINSTTNNLDNYQIEPTFINRYNDNDNNNNNNNCAFKVGLSSCGLLLNCILIGWFFAGCLMIFRSYEPNYYDRTSHRFCNQTLYLFTFYLIVSVGLVFLILITIVIGLMVASTMFNRRNLDDDTDSSI